MNSIRISDHKGYDHLSYRYNANNNYRAKDGMWRKDSKGFWKYFTGTQTAHLDALIFMIMSAKINKKTKYNYDKLIEKYKEESRNAKGFWEKAWEVTLNTEINGGEL